jgi:hypothetical protein
MLAAAVLTIAAAAEPTRRVAPEDQIPLTKNETATSSPPSSSPPPTAPATGCTGHNGGAATSTAPEPATTSGKQPKNSPHNDLRLEY